MRNDMRQVQLEMQVVSDNERVAKRAKQVDKDLDTQFSSIRLQMRSVQLRHEKLKELKHLLKRLQDCISLGLG